MNVDREDNGAAVVVRVKPGCWFDGNHMNQETLQQIKQCLLKSFEEGKTDIIIDLKHLQPNSDDWIPILVTAYKLILANHGGMKLVNPSSSVKEVLQLTRLDRVFQVDDFANGPATNSQIRTHYQNLKVSRDASLQEIQSAHRALISQYESGWIKGDSDAERIRRIIDKAFQILSDPVKRKEHDDWIASEEAPQIMSQPRADSQQPPSTSDSLSGRGSSKARQYMKPLVITLGIVGIALALAWGERYKPLGSAGQFVYVHDRITGEVFALAGNYRLPIQKQ